MKPAGRCLVRNCLLVLAAVVIFSLAMPQARSASVEPLNEDARITGRQVHVFADQGQTVAVVLGDFELTAGQTRITARDAVVWVRDIRAGGMQHEISIYAEGDVTVREPAASANDKMMFIRLVQDGRLTVNGAVSREALADFPLYQRAVEARRQPWAQGPGGATHRAPPLVIAREPASRPTAVAQARPPLVIRGTGGTVSAPAGGPASRPGAKAGEPIPQPVEPVTFYAKSFSSQMLPSGQRVTIGRGDVYVTQGNPDSDMFLSLQSQVAVVFTAPGPQTRPADTPAGGSSIMPAPGGQQEAITGIYLEDDVLLVRGEKSVRASAAYYDFTNDTAVVIDPVFRTIQEQRIIPIYVRASEARALSAREMWFKDAKFTSSDFYNPSYYIGAKTAYLRDAAPYDEQKVRLGPASYEARLSDTTFDVQGVPIFWWPYQHIDFQEGHTALRSVQAGRSGRFGWGVDTEWNLFRVLGLLAPQGFHGRMDLAYYERGLLGGAEMDYARTTADRRYSGYDKLFGVYDRKQLDTFGEDREDIPAPSLRGRALGRHKEFFGDGWEAQFELSYICDRNFLEEFYREEFWAGKPQETLAYAKKQQDNWAFTAILQYRLNRFETQNESWPDLGFNLIGQSLAGDRLSVFSENHAGIRRFRPDNASDLSSSAYYARLDTRDEVDAPMHAGPLNFVPFAVGRLSYWSDTPLDDGRCRPMAVGGARLNTHLWRVYDDASSRTWDVNRLKHVVTPELTAFIDDTGGVEPDELFPTSDDVERQKELSGIAASIHQRLQTKRGVGANARTVDWMRLTLTAAWFGNEERPSPLDGRFFWYRPEQSRNRDSINADYTWNISDSTAVFADANYDMEEHGFSRASAALAVSRDPRVRYYLGMQWFRDLDSNVGTAGVNYTINKKYSVSFFQQYDFLFDDGRNLATSISLVRKFSRWYGALTFVVDETQDSAGVFLTLWPEGVPEFRLGTGRIGLPGSSSEN